MTARGESVALPADARVPSIGTRWLRGFWWFVRHKPLGAFGLVVLVAIVLVALFSPWLIRYPYTEQHLADGLRDPGSEYWLGTDKQGRDVFSRMIIGSQVTVLVGLGTVMLAAFISVLVGGVSGYLGGRFDIITQRVVDVWVSLPPIFLLLTFVAVLGSGGDGFLGLGRGPDVGLKPYDGDWIWYTFFRSSIVILALGVIFAGYGSRIVRGSVLSVKEHAYVEAARAMGAGDLRIMLCHILPNVLPVVIILATLNLGAAVLAEATISFLGFGIQAPFPTWGQILGTDGRLYAQDSAQHLMWVPGAAIFISVYGFNMLGDALRDILDPRLRGAR